MFPRVIFAILAIIAFAIAFILHVAGSGKLVEDAWLLGLVFVACHLAAGPWRRAGE
jgi:hypothetical protein